MAYSCALQQVGKAACRWKWGWSSREALEVKASLLVHAFWYETGVDLTVASIKLCWEAAPRALYCQKESGPTTHIITFLDELAVCVPSVNMWPQLVWPPVVAIPCALTEAELYGYCHSQVVDLGPVMPVAQFQVMEEEGAYLCIVRALVFEGSALVYNPAMNEVEWVPVRGLANDLTWAEERSAMALANYVPCIPAEAAQIARLGAYQIVSCPEDFSTSEEEETQHSNPQTMDPEHEDESEDRAGQNHPEEEAEPNRWQHPRNWEAIMEGAEGLTYDDLQLDSMAMVMGWKAYRSLHYPCVMRPPTIHPTPEACNPVHARVADGPYATTGGGNCQRRCHRGACRRGRAGQPLSQRPKGRPLMQWNIRC